MSDAEAEAWSRPVGVRDFTLVAQVLSEAIVKEAIQQIRHGCIPFSRLSAVFSVAQSPPELLQIGLGS
jgi:hypothetical protein